jgi:hypothetical protein
MRSPAALLRLPSFVGFHKFRLKKALCRVSCRVNAADATPVLLILSLGFVIGAGAVMFCLIVHYKRRHILRLEPVNFLPGGYSPQFSTCLVTPRHRALRRRTRPRNRLTASHRPRGEFCRPVIRLGGHRRKSY